MRNMKGIPTTFRLVRLGIPFTVIVTVFCPEENPGFEAWIVTVGLEAWRGVL
jgi:hypothetical protein